MEPSVDVMAVGDMVVDNFIRLKEASVHCRIDTEACEICMRWGDKIPFEFSMDVPGVGNSANFAVSVARLGLTAALRAYVGEDTLGEACIDSLKKEGVGVAFVEKVLDKHTNHHYVLWFGSERTILIKHEVFDYQIPTTLPTPRWLYLSSLGENSLPYHELLAKLLAGWPGTKLAFQPGTFQIQAGVEKLQEIYKRSDIFFCNKEEAEHITRAGPTEDIKKLLVSIKQLGPKIVVITNDRKGAYALDDENHFYYIPMYPDPRPPYERTGAGDAFASSVVAALALGKPLPEALLWGPINAMAVVQDIGAQKGLLTREQLQAYMDKAPKEYALQDL